MKSKKGKKKSSGGEAITRILGLGPVDLNFKLQLTKEDLTKAQLEFDSIASVKDLRFLVERQDLWKTIKLSTDNMTLNTFLFLNKASKKKAYVDYVPFALPTFNDEEKFIGDIIKHVTEQMNFLCINETPLMEGRYCYVFDIFCEDKKKTLSIGTSKQEAAKQKEEEEEEQKKKEEEKKDKELTQGKEQEPQEGKPQESIQPQKKEEPHQQENQPEKNTFGIQNKDSPLCKMNMKCSSYDLFYVDFNDILFIDSPNFQLDDFVDFLIYLKTRAAPPTIVISFPCFADMINEMLLINRVLIMTDIYYFNLKEATTSFDSHYKVFTEERPIKAIDERKTFDYFISGIARGGGSTVYGNKIGIFLDDFSKMTIVEATKKHADKIVYDCQPYPKVNHVNLKLVEWYKDLIKKNFSFLRAIFLGGYLSKSVSSKGKGQELIYPSFLVGLEIVKRIVEILKNNLPLSEDESFFYVKLSKSKIEQDLKTYFLENKEGGFVLDCVNKEKSTMKDYMPLYDYHLNSFFSSNIVRKDLKSKGFINTKGFIMYDPVYRSVMGASFKSNPNEINQKEMNEKIMEAIQGINVGQNYKAKEIDTHTHVLRSKSPTSNKIPLPTLSSEYCNTKADVRKSTEGNKAKSKSKPAETCPNEPKDTQNA